MKLSDLDGQLLKIMEDRSLRHVTDLAEADGVMFLCPKCYAENTRAEKREGVHSVICWFRGKVADDLSSGPGRWNPSGTGLHDLSFVPPGAVSVALQGGCAWHGHVREGDAT